MATVNKYVKSQRASCRHCCACAKNVSTRIVHVCCQCWQNIWSHTQLCDFMYRLAKMSIDNINFIYLHNVCIWSHTRFWWTTKNAMPVSKKWKQQGTSVEHKIRVFTASSQTKTKLIALIRLCKIQFWEIHFWKENTIRNKWSLK